jgi:hypothetical protein
MSVYEMFAVVLLRQKGMEEGGRTAVWVPTLNTKVAYIRGWGSVMDELQRQQLRGWGKGVQYTVAKPSAV